MGCEFSGVVCLMSFIGVIEKHDGLHWVLDDLEISFLQYSCCSIPIKYNHDIQISYMQ